MEMPLLVLQLVRVNIACFNEHEFIYIFIIIPLGTHDVVDVYVNISSRAEIKCECIFNAGSYALGCLVNLTNIAKGVTFCIVSQRFSYISVSTSCKISNETVETGRYLLMVYDIIRDGTLSTLPAIIEEILITVPPPWLEKPSYSRM